MLIQMGVKRIPNEWDDIYIEVQSLDLIEPTVFKMLGIVCGLFWREFFIASYEGTKKRYYLI